MSDHEGSGSQSSHEVPEKKQTSLGLYVTAQEAYEMWKAAPDEVKILDVRIPGGVHLRGPSSDGEEHPPPLREVRVGRREGPTGRGTNPDFAPAVMKAYRSRRHSLGHVPLGGRSALAVNGLAKAGFTRAYNVIDGFEGDKVDDPASAYHGKRMRNGWKNSGSPLDLRGRSGTAVAREA